MFLSLFLFFRNSTTETVPTPLLLSGAMEQSTSSPIMHLHPTSPLDHQDHRQKNIAEAANAEKQLWKLIHFKGLLCTDAQELYRLARSSYEKIILNDHEVAELRDAEYSLWKLHYKHIDKYRNKIHESSANKEHKNLTAVQQMTTVQQNCDKLLKGLKSFLSEATEFYQQLIIKVRRTYGSPREVLSFNDSGLSGLMALKEINRCQFSCHRCFVCLGDLARYRELYVNPDAGNRNWSVAATYYFNATKIEPNSGNPQNQLALLAIYIGDELLALYHCIRSLAVKDPFPDAWNNLLLLFEKNRSCHLRSVTNEGTFNYLIPSERSIMQIKGQSSNSFPHSKIEEATRDVLPEASTLWSLIVRLISFFYVKSSLKDFLCTFGSTIRELESLLSLEDARLKSGLESYQRMDVARRGPFRVLQVISVLMFTIHILTESPKLEIPAHITDIQQPSLTLEVLASTFILMGRIIDRCVATTPVNSSPLLPAILVFVEWLVDMIGTAEKYVTDDKCESAISYYFKAFVDLLNGLDDKGEETDSWGTRALWEDTELHGFSPASKLHQLLDFQTEKEPSTGFDDRNQCEVRVHRIFVAAMKVVNRSIGSRKWICFEKITRKFSTTESKPSGRTKSEAAKDSRGKFVMDSKNFQCEEEEIILFKPIRRYNSAPLYVPETTTVLATTERIRDLAAPSGESFLHVSSLKLPRSQSSIDPSSLGSDGTGFSCGKTFWQEAIPEDSVLDTFIEHSADLRSFEASHTMMDGLPSPTGPPSLSGWILNRENSGSIGVKESRDSTASSSRDTEDIASAYITGLSVGRTALSQHQQNINVTSSAPTSHMNDGYPVIDSYSPKTTHYPSPPHLGYLPSAPLLPDDATWFTGDSYKDDEQTDLEAMKQQLLETSQVNSYFNSTGAPKFEQSTAVLANGNGTFAGRTHSAQWSHQYQDSLGLDRVHEYVSPFHLYRPNSDGRVRDNDRQSRFTLLDPIAGPLASPQMKHLEDTPFRVGCRDVNGVDEQKKERLFYGYPRVSPHVYGPATDLRSEQLLLLQYLKQKEWHLQREAELRGSS